MRNLLIVFVSIIVISNILEISSAKRIRRDVYDNHNHTNISEDFVVLKAGSKKNLENKVIKSTTKKDNKSLYDAALVALTTKSFNGQESKGYHGNNEQNTDEFETIKKQTIASPLAYVLRNLDQKPAENLNDTQRASMQLPAHKAKSYNNLEDLKDRQNSIRNKSEDNIILPSFGHEAANIVGAHVIIPPRYLMSSHTFYPFAPIEQMMRFANTLFYKGGMDDTAENANSPIEFNSLDSPLPQEFVDSPTYALAQISSSHQGQIESLPHTKSNNSKEALGDRKYFDLIDLLENVFNNPEKDQTIHGEIEIYCPLHNGKGNTAHGNCHTNLQTDDVHKGDVLEVCSCHMVKDKDISHKNHK